VKINNLGTYCEEVEEGRTASIFVNKNISGRPEFSAKTL
jgi:hypothetical protein